MREDPRIIAAIVKKAEENNLPVTAENINIRRSANAISIDVDYTVPIDFPGKTFNWAFHAHAENPLF
jgi:hypothetical protein